MKPRYSKDILPVLCPSLYQGSSVFCLVFIHSSFTYQLLLVHRVTLYIFLKSFHCITIITIKECRSLYQGRRYIEVRYI